MAATAATMLAGITAPDGARASMAMGRPITARRRPMAMAAAMSANCSPRPGGLVGDWLTAAIKQNRPISIDKPRPSRPGLFLAMGRNAAIAFRLRLSVKFLALWLTPRFRHL